MHQDLDKITDLDAWVEQVHLLNTELANKQAEWLRFAMDRNLKTREMAKGASATKLGNTATTAPHLPPPLTRLKSVTPRLIATERQLLKEHQGCFYCQTFYSGHFSTSCPLGPNECPSSEACKNVTVAEAMKAKVVWEKT
jgi:hypothetical protein